jgi:hypothetical protein
MAALLVPVTVAPPAAAAASVDVWPRTDIVDDEPLLISIRSWPDDNAWLAVDVCPAGRAGRSRLCDHVTSLVPGPRGNIRVRRPADVIVDLRNERVDCRVDDCVLRVLDPNGRHERHSPILRLPLEFDPTGPDPTRPAMTVTPDDDLREGDEVRVTGDGLPLWGAPPAPEGGGPARPFTIYQCPTSALSHRFCDIRRVGGGLNPAGDFSKRFTVHSRLYLDTGATVDCRVEACALFASATGEFSEAGLVPLAFDPAGPAAPPPTVSVDPAIDLVDGQVVTVTGEHFLPNRSVNLYQCPPDPTGYPWRACHEFFALDSTDAEGEITVTWSVHATFERHRRPPVDCRTVACSFVLTWANADEAPDAPITIDPAAPLIDQELTATPTSGLVGGQTITVEGAGYYQTDMTRVAQCVLMPNRPDETFPCAEIDELVIIEPPSRSFTTEFQVRRRILVGPGWVNCAVRYCYLRSGDMENDEVRGPRLQFAAP